MLPAALCLGLAVPALAVDASGLDAASAGAFYQELWAYLERVFVILYADLRDLDADGVPEMIVVSSQRSDGTYMCDTAVVDIWQAKNGTAEKVTSAECAASMTCGMGYISSGGKVYIDAWCFSIRHGFYSKTEKFITVGGYTETLNEYGSNGAEPPIPAEANYSRELAGQRSDVTEAEFMQYLGAYMGRENVYKDSNEGAGVLVRFDQEYFLSAGGQSWMTAGEDYTSYQPVLNQLSAVKNASASAVLSTAFTDVPSTAYYASAVTWAVGKGITNGTGTNKFSPENTCNNAEILTFIWRAKGQPEPTIFNPFSNVNSSDFYYKAALWAYQNGLVTGSLFNASVPCTRSMAVTYLWKAAGSPAAGASGFSDVPASASYAQAVAWAVNQGITNGDGTNTFSPDKTCTRGQIVTFLYRAFA